MRKIAIVAVLAAGACTQSYEPDTTPDIGAVCGAGDLQGLVGQPRSVLQTMKFSTEVRITGEGDPVTMDFRAERLNITNGTDGRISRVFCG